MDIPTRQHRRWSELQTRLTRLLPLVIIAIGICLLLLGIANADGILIITGFSILFFLICIDP